MAAAQAVERTLVEEDMTLQVAKDMTTTAQEVVELEALTTMAEEVVVDTVIGVEDLIITAEEERVAEGMIPTEVKAVLQVVEGMVPTEVANIVHHLAMLMIVDQVEEEVAMTTNVGALQVVIIIQRQVVEWKVVHMTVDMEKVEEITTAEVVVVHVDMIVARNIEESMDMQLMMVVTIMIQRVIPIDTLAVVQ